MADDMMTVKKCRKILQEHGNHNFDDKSDDWMQGFINYLYHLAELQIENEKWMAQQAQCTK